MNCLLVLSKENLELSEYEAASLLGLKKYSLKDNLLIADVGTTSLKNVCRLAYSRKAFELLFKCKIDALKKKILSYDWSDVYKESFCMRIHHHELSEKQYASYAWQSLEKSGIKPKVDLDNPRTLIEIFVIKKECYVCKLACENSDDFESRKTEFWPEHHPTTMNPRMARALVNIACSDSIIDPFCGAGGILIEAGMMGLKCTGYDIDKEMLVKASANLHHYGINKNMYKLKRYDSTRLKGLNNVVTDLPYGKSSKKTGEINKLYSRFMKCISGRAVIVFPDFVDYKNIVKRSISKKLSIKKAITHYVHKSLTRIIVVIDKK